MKWNGIEIISDPNVPASMNGYWLQGVTIKPRAGLQGLAASCCTPKGGMYDFYTKGKWHEADCSTAQKEANKGDSLYSPDWSPYTPHKKICDCGAIKTVNPNCHSSWCSAAGK